MTTATEKFDGEAYYNNRMPTRIDRLIKFALKEIRDKFDMEKSDDKCRELIEQAEEMGLNELAEEMKNDLQVGKDNHEAKNERN